jgi:hypothetical protein
MVQSRTLWRELMKTMMMAALVAVLAFGASAAKAAETSIGFGSGELCYTVEHSSPQNLSMWGGWILGYWSGVNSRAQTGISTGYNTDGYKIVGLVDDECNRHPSETIQTAVEAVYNRTASAYGM